jgi:hypothetical protein
LNREGQTGSFLHTGKKSVLDDTRATLGDRWYKERNLGERKGRRGEGKEVQERGSIEAAGWEDEL